MYRNDVVLHARFPFLCLEPMPLSYRIECGAFMLADNASFHVEHRTRFNGNKACKKIFHGHFANEAQSLAVWPLCVREIEVPRFCAHFWFRHTANGKERARQHVLGKRIKKKKMIFFFISPPHPKKKKKKNICFFFPPPPPQKKKTNGYFFFCGGGGDEKKDHFFFFYALSE